jgi:replicative DNA helicase
MKPDEFDVAWEAAKAGEIVPPAGMFDDDPPVDAYESLPENLPENVIPIRRESRKTAAVDTTSTMGDALKAALLEMRARVERGGKLAGVPTGFSRLDKALDGMQRGKVYVLAGRSGMGKSIVALNLALRVGASGEGVDYVTIEMPTGEQATRAMFCWSGVGSHRWKNSTLRMDDWAQLGAALKTMSAFTWVWDDASSVTIEQLIEQVQRTKARFAEQGKTLFLVVVDHVLNIKGSNSRQPRREQVLHITGQLKALAKSEDVCVLALAQLNRALESRGVKDKRPQISDLKESGSFEEDADAIMLLYRRDHYEKDRSQWDNVLEMSLPKIRGGEPAFVKLQFDGNRYRINTLASERDTDDQEQPEDRRAGS